MGHQSAAAPERRPALPAFANDARCGDIHFRTAGEHGAKIGARGARFRQRHAFAPATTHDRELEHWPRAPAHAQ